MNDSIRELEALIEKHEADLEGLRLALAHAKNKPPFVYGQKASSSVTFAEGEFKIDIHYETKKLVVWHRGNPWRELIGDRFIFALAAELDQTLRQRDDAEQCDTLESKRADEWERHCRQAEYLADKARDALCEIGKIVVAEVQRKTTDCRKCKLNDNCPGFDDCPELKGTNV